MAAFTYTVGTRESDGSKFRIPVHCVWSSSTYTAGGEPITAAILGLNAIEEVDVEDSAGYLLDGIIATGGATMLLKAYAGGAVTTGATSGGTPAGSIVVTPHADSAGTSSYTIPNGVVASAIGLDAGGNLVAAVGTVVLTVTPTGTHSHADTAAFTGSALATHTHTAGGVFAEASGSISAAVDIMVYGY